MTSTVFFNLLTTLTLLGGLFFMLAGALGVWRLPDLYHRMIAASKCITFGITGMLLASVFHLAVLSREAEAGDRPQPSPSSSVVAVGTKAILVILFQFVAAPMAAHVLARAAHRDGAPTWQGTLSDDLAEDRALHTITPSPTGKPSPDGPSEVQR